MLMLMLMLTSMYPLFELPSTSKAPRVSDLHFLRRNRTITADFFHDVADHHSRNSIFERFWP
ncbi:hypothetical protein SAMD00023353_0202600 [Rosellinia necatrix]|uniref:Uncharacterized protein n=1 Tax=Rosellinia necatrix TaxID=77044 RepID=A0A1S8A4Y0_ROSNE|nr:hypothetical protein SAMD00023353_0202600 [Rosellinia necatrix]